MISYEDIINEVIEKLPKIEISMKFEVIKSIYPDSSIPKEIKITNEGFTKPLALSSKDKIKIRKKENDLLKDFLNFKNLKKEKGDILVVIKKEKDYYFCENISRPKNISETYYNDENLKYIKINYRDILEGNIKQILRIRN